MKKIDPYSFDVFYFLTVSRLKSTIAAEHLHGTLKPPLLGTLKPLCRIEFELLHLLRFLRELQNPIPFRHLRLINHAIMKEISSSIEATSSATPNRHLHLLFSPPPLDFLSSLSTTI
ncbi:unnamed protein product [Lactuca saligna]|uniref:Uncharacterized protein n=1 Tax=Lactuca saligna TaxID=75948 RepID=A0AA35ZUH2_LACSI|nr:unnamed protein product [Lactuca saligna]